MVEPHVLAQVHTQRQAGINENEIRRILRIQGFSDLEIADAMALSPTAPVAVVAAPAPARAQNPVSNVMPHSNPSAQVLNVMPTARAPIEQEVVSAPVPVASPVSAVEAAQVIESETPRAGRLGTILLTVSATLVLAACGIGAMYAYTQHIGPFAG